MKFKILFSGILAFCSMGVKAEERLDILVVWAKDGSTPSFVLEQRPHITFTTTDLVIQTAQVEVVYALSQVERLTYEQGEVAGLVHGLSSENVVRMKGNCLFFPDLSAESKVDIYRTDGGLVLERTILETGSYTLSLENLAAGTYLIRLNGITYKIMKR